MPAISLSSTALGILLHCDHQAIGHDQGGSKISMKGCGDAILLVIGGSESVPDEVCA